MCPVHMSRVFPSSGGVLVFLAVHPPSPFLDEAVAFLQHRMLLKKLPLPPELVGFEGSPAQGAATEMAKTIEPEGTPSYNCGHRLFACIISSDVRRAKRLDGDKKNRCHLAMQEGCTTLRATLVTNYRAGIDSHKVC